MVGTIYKASSHDDASVWFDGIGKHVGSIGMCAVVVARTRLSFRIGFTRKPPKSGMVAYISFAFFFHHC